MKRVLMIVYTFPPHGGGGVQRNLKFANYLKESGWEATILTITPYKWSCMDDSLLKEVDPSIDVRRCFSFEARRLPAGIFRILELPPIRKIRRLLQYPDHCIGWLPFALSGIDKIMKEKKIDLIYSSFPPATSHLIAMKTGKKYGIPWVADYRDPWTRHPRNTGAKFNPFKRLYRRLEHKFMLAADAVIVTASMVKAEMASDHGVDPDKISLITNGYDLTDFSGLIPRKNNKNITFVYSGSPPADDKLGPFYEALKTLQESSIAEGKKVRFVIVGDSDLAKSRTPDAGGLGQIEVLTTGYLDHRESIQQILDADILVLYSWGKNLIPGKTFEYMRTGRPVLALADKEDEVSGFIEKNSAGVWAPAEDKEKIIAAINRLLSDRHDPNRSGHPEYERRELTKKLAGVFDSVLKGKGR